MQRITATVAPWSTLVTKAGDGFTGKITKDAMRRTLNSEHHRKVEFSAHQTPFQRGGYFFIDDLDEAIVEVRYNNDRDVMLLEVTPGDSIKVR
jgi:hypothetical protein